MKIKFIVSAISAALIAGCNDDSINVTSETPTGPEVPEVVIPTHFSSKLSVGGQIISGDVSCNGEVLGEEAKITLAYGDDIRCYFGNVELASFPPFVYKQESNLKTIPSESMVIDGDHSRNAHAVLRKVSTCPSENRICLEEINSFDIAEVYQNLDDEALVKEFLTPQPEENTGEAPSSHVDDTVIPEVSTGTNDDKFGQEGAFVSANVEENLAYKPSSESALPTLATLTDISGQKPIAGVQFYTRSKRGTTDENGQFEFVWGEEITFGIDTFNFGKVKGNQVSYKLTDVTGNTVVQQNIQQLAERYDTDSSAETITFGPKVHEVFALYPNVINEVINLSLPNGAALLDDKGNPTGFKTPDEFSAQFNTGLAALIDAELNKASSYQFSRMFDQSKTVSMQSGGYVTDTLTALYKQVDQFHVFHDTYSWYGASGSARGQRALNLSNRAFPIMMARNDNSHWLGFGEEAAWTRGSGKDQKAYFVDATVLDSNSTIELERPMKLAKDNVTFNLPFVASGEIGSGKIVYMGNSMYPSIISCPDNYWAGAELSINGEEQACNYKGTFEEQTADSRNDDGSMATFFANMFNWFDTEYKNKTIASNIELGYAFETWKADKTYPFFVSPSFGFSNYEYYSSGQFGDLIPETTPILILQGYEQLTSGYETKATLANIDKPILTPEDISDLIRYVSNGGNILVMEAIGPRNPEPIARLFDSAGMAVGESNTVFTRQAYCGSSYYCHGDIAPNVHAQLTGGLVVYERYADTSKITIEENAEGKGTVVWPGPVDMPTLEIPRFKDANNEAKGEYAFFAVNSEEEKLAAIAKIKKEFPQAPVCKDPYEYEVNCIEYREGHGIQTRGNYLRPDFTRYPMNQEVVAAMVKAANLGDNITALYNHELYYRTKSQQGERLPSAELNAVYDNLSIWLWNNENYQYDSSVQDELGFQTLVQFLNCYTSNAHQQGANVACPDELGQSLVDNNLIHANGELNPSYPLNYMEKPLTRIMLGRSYWDHDIVVDTTVYPGRPKQIGTSADATIQTYRNPVTFAANNRQATGLWAPQLENVTVTGGTAGTITVALVDDLTGRNNHELALNRPPRVETSFAYNGSSLTFKVPYGGLIYISPAASQEQATVTYKFDNVVKGSYWKNDAWLHGYNDDVPLADIDTGHFIYTTPVKNVQNAEKVRSFVVDINRFANAASDFYGRDQNELVGDHRRFTSPSVLPEHRHHFVNDRQISIGAAHSGYPVQSSSFNVNATTIPTNPVNDWLLWHEVGHNLAAAPFSVAGSTEVTNNILALYMQELREDLPEMTRIKLDIQKMDTWMSMHGGHAWSEADAGIRLVMFGQLKLWAEDHFDINKWYSADVLPTVFDTEKQGWNLFKLMHRMARGETFAEDANYCNQQATGLNASDTMMVCASYASGYDLRDFFLQWNPGEVKADMPNGESDYSGGITSNGLATLNQLDLPTAPKSPLSYTSL
ncbi:sugar ABC transporter substrate-binding protein [Vibrio ponticus]|uniref:Sugar ABC transporter substrate-binding protein n=1 Tax=Vibrio ponticus TaxID=265668 RepID=A0ABX3FMU6_9VIBR|nr:SslE/AcfD family lipoprotein zinc metalloprotease [Vibrio ponticus]OLQ94327.1 sugar ABC transporter substrate-binding protein [Vibrio ponticus]